ncbi:fucolectin-7-like [Mytilus trossulus]|uniref:fucolectin-7-like n=1 Tax=Mytilus trossulus TaxID=6551 RepID=UPI0030040F43
MSTMPFFILLCLFHVGLTCQIIITGNNTVSCCTELERKVTELGTKIQNNALKTEVEELKNRTEVIENQNKALEIKVREFERKVKSNALMAKVDEPKESTDVKQIWNKGSCGKKNLALHKTCRQSSYHEHHKCDKAVDGDLSNFIHTQITMKNGTWHGESYPYFWVDLNNSCLIKLIKIYNRKECCGDRLRNVEVTIGHSLSNMKLCGFYKGPAADGEIVNIYCKVPMVARYVKVMLKENKIEETVINFAEVEVFAK